MSGHVRLLVSVRDVDEASLAAAAGVDLVDCKDPGAGALGALSPSRVASIVRALRANGFDGPVSATIGDVPPEAVTEILRRVEAVAACGVNLVKVGVAPGAAGVALVRALADACASRTSRALAGASPGAGRGGGGHGEPPAAADTIVFVSTRRVGGGPADDDVAAASPADRPERRPPLSPGGPARVVPVLLSDDGLDDTLLDAVLSEPVAFAAVMLDTATKGAGSLLDRVAAPTLARFVAAVRATGRAAGLAGSLGFDDVRRLHALRPDFAGFRGALCAGPRDGPLDVRAVRRLRARLAAHAGAGTGATTAA
jgi:uncharacterized protein (UPF0264 family)